MGQEVSTAMQQQLNDGPPTSFDTTAWTEQYRAAAAQAEQNGGATVGAEHQPPPAVPPALPKAPPQVPTTNGDRMEEDAVSAATGMRKRKLDVFARERDSPGPSHARARLTGTPASVASSEQEWISGNHLRKDALEMAESDEPIALKVNLFEPVMNDLRIRLMAYAFRQGFSWAKAPRPNHADSSDVLLVCSKKQPQCPFSVTISRAPNECKVVAMTASHNHALEPLKGALSTPSLALRVPSPAPALQKSASATPVPSIRTGTEEVDDPELVPLVADPQVQDEDWMAVDHGSNQESPAISAWIGNGHPEPAAVEAAAEASGGSTSSHGFVQVAQPVEAVAEAPPQVVQPVVEPPPQIIQPVIVPRTQQPAPPVPMYQSQPSSPAIQQQQQGPIIPAQPPASSSSKAASQPFFARIKAAQPQAPFSPIGLLESIAKVGKYAAPFVDSGIDDLSTFDDFLHMPPEVADAYYNYMAGNDNPQPKNPAKLAFFEKTRLKNKVANLRGWVEEP